MKIGFLGTGHITSSVIEGIVRSKLKIKKIYISPRNRLVSKKLSQKFKKVSVSKNNQQLIKVQESAETVHIFKGISRKLQFRVFNVVFREKKLVPVHDLFPVTWLDVFAKFLVHCFSPVTWKEVPGKIPLSRFSVLGRQGSYENP